jgi:hypothetical protein
MAQSVPNTSFAAPQWRPIKLTNQPFHLVSQESEWGNREASLLDLPTSAIHAQILRQRLLSQGQLVINPYYTQNPHSKVNECYRLP